MFNVQTSFRLTLIDFYNRVLYKPVVKDSNEEQQQRQQKKKEVENLVQDCSGRNLSSSH